MNGPIKTLAKLLLGRECIKSFGQFGEDAIIQKLLQSKVGVYIDVGAYHPTLYSNTYALYKRGWSGVVIDPNPEAKLLYRLFRPRDTFITAAVGHPGEKVYYQYTDGAFNQVADGEPPLPNGVSVVKKHPVSVIPLRELIPKKPVDLLTVDVEGLDTEVLETHNWDYPPRVIAVEVHGFDPEHPYHSPSYVFLKDKGYQLTAWSGVTLLFTKKYKRA